MRNKLFVGLVALLLLWALAYPGWAEEKTGRLELVGVSDDAMTGRYETTTGIFHADVTDTPNAYVQLEFDDIVITSRVLEWFTKDDYLIASIDATLTSDDLDLTSDRIEYYSEEERLIATGSVVVITDDGRITSDELTYYEQEDKAIFVGNVVAEMTDGTFYGEKLVFYIDTEDMEFFGPFRGEFSQN